jgi:transposase InsO family protein
MGTARRQFTDEFKRAAIGVLALSAMRHRQPTRFAIAPNRLDQNRRPAPQSGWLADICVPTGEGWFYLAAVLDLLTRTMDDA